MVYRENAKEKLPLFYVHIAFNHEGKQKAHQQWIRARDSFKALEALIKQCETTSANVWSQHVITKQDFDDKDLEME